MMFVSIIMILEILLLDMALANGERSGVRKDRVVGGSEASLREFPFQGKLSTIVRVLRDAEREYITQSDRCNGAIIRSNWVLTAAHCVERINPSNLWFIIESGSRFHPEAYEVSSIAIHPDYLGTAVNDIALLRLSRNIPFDERVHPIALPIADITNHNLSADFAGWGYSREDNQVPFKLQKIKLNFTSDKECETLAYPHGRKFICVTHQNGEGPCMEDGGAPLVVDGIIVGMSPIIYNCAWPYPNVFIRIYSYINWIKNIMERYG